jgi:hypothetical protein
LTWLYKIAFGKTFDTVIVEKDKRVFFTICGIKLKDTLDLDIKIQD